MKGVIVIILHIKYLSQCILPAGMPTNERAIAAAAYAAAHSRSKGCPLLGQIAYSAFMEEAHEHIAHECPTHFHV